MLAGHTNVVSFVEFCPSAPGALLSSSFDGTCRIWHAADASVPAIVLQVWVARTDAPHVVIATCAWCFTSLSVLCSGNSCWAATSHFGMQSTAILRKYLQASPTFGPVRNVTRLGLGLRTASGAAAPLGSRRGEAPIEIDMEDGLLGSAEPNVSLSPGFVKFTAQRCVG